MVIGIKVQILVGVLFDRAICIHTGNTVSQMPVNTLDGVFFRIGQFFVFFRQIKFCTGGHHHVEYPNRIAKNFMVSVDVVRIHFADGFVAPEQRHPHSFINKNSAFVYADIVLFRLRGKAAVGSSLLRGGHTLALRCIRLGKSLIWLGNRFIRRLHRSIRSAQDSNIIVTDP